MKATARPPLSVTADGRGGVSRAGSRLLADLAGPTTLTAGLSAALAGLGRPRTVHDPGRVLVGLAVAVADGAECISDIAVLAAARELAGQSGDGWAVADRGVGPSIPAQGLLDLATVERARSRRRGGTPLFLWR